MYIYIYIYIYIHIVSSLGKEPKKSKMAHPEYC